MNRISINGFRIPVLSKLNYFKDGKDATAVLFIKGPHEKFMISFEEGMKCIDLIVKDTEKQKYIHSEYEQDGRYLHQCRTDLQHSVRKKHREGRYSMAYFHIKMPDQNGNICICPGQMSVAPGYSWSDGVEPILLELLAGMEVEGTAAG